MTMNDWTEAEITARLATLGAAGWRVSYDHATIQWVVRDQVGRVRATMTRHAMIGARSGEERVLFLGMLGHAIDSLTEESHP